MGSKLQVDTTTDFYNKQSSTYDLIQGYSYWEILYSEYNKWIKKHLDTKNLSIADLGCGTGLTSDLLLEKNNNVFGLDLTLPLLKQAQKRHHVQKFKGTQGDITKLPFKDNSFDGVVCLDTLEHIEFSNKALSEISRICKKRGMILFDIPSSAIFDFSYFFGYYGKKGLVSALKGLAQKKVMFEWESLDDNYEPQRINTYRYRPSYFEEMLRANGFNIVEKKGVHISTMLIPEKVQANTSSPLLSKINSVLNKADDFLNKIPSIKNHALYILYACRLA